MDEKHVYGCMCLVNRLFFIEIWDIEIYVYILGRISMQVSRRYIKFRSYLNLKYKFSQWGEVYQQFILIIVIYVSTLTLTYFESLFTLIYLLSFSEMALMQSGWETCVWIDKSGNSNKDGRIVNFILQIHTCWLCWFEVSSNHWLKVP